jgi:hypothetical protein
LHRTEAEEHRTGLSVLESSGYRFLAVFTLLAIFNTYDPLNVIPFCGPWISSRLDCPLAAAAPWVAVHLFHISGIAATPHLTDSRDTALGWITILLIVAISLAVAVVWSVMDRCPRHDRRLAVWTRYILRFVLAFIMIRYGAFKIFPLQMSRPSLAVLNEPLGQSSPMTLLWTLIGLSPAYQIISGALEALTGILLFFRRTALVGALVGFVVVTNVTLLNLCFDVPVKLGAILILFALGFIIAPDVPSLLSYFWKHAPAGLSSLWSPQWDTRTSRTAARFLEAAFALCVLYYLIPSAYTLAKQEAAHRRSPSSLTGGWHVDSARMLQGDQLSDAPVFTAEGLPMTAIYFEPDGRVMARSDDGRLWRAGAAVDAAHHKLTLYSGYFHGERFDADYTYAQVDENHLRLDPIGDAKASHSTVLLTRLPLLDHYPLLQDRFRWVQEWALER